MSTTKIALTGKMRSGKSAYPDCFTKSTDSIIRYLSETS